MTSSDVRLRNQITTFPVRRKLVGQKKAKKSKDEIK